MDITSYKLTQKLGDLCLYLQRNNTTNNTSFIVTAMDFITLIDYLGTFAFAISGIRLAARNKFDLFGAYVVGFVTAVGGGTLRDLMIGVTPFWMRQPSYVIITGIALLIVIILKKWIVRFDNTIFTFDAVGLGLFTVVGFERTLMAGFPMWVCIIMGSVTGAAGGMLRDVLINEVPLIFRKDIYALACVGGGVVYWLMHISGIDPNITGIVAAVSVILIRVLCVLFNISLPSLSPESDNDTPAENNAGN